MCSVYGKESMDNMHTARNEEGPKFKKALTLMKCDTDSNKLESLFKDLSSQIIYESEGQVVLIKSIK